MQKKTTIHWTIPFLATAFLLLGQRSNGQTTIPIDSNVIQKLCANQWRLMYMDNFMDGQKNRYFPQSSPMFYPNGRFIDGANARELLSEEKCLQVYGKVYPYYAVGQWKVNKDALVIDLNKDSTKIKDQVFYGTLSITQLSDSSVTFFKSLTSDKSWTRTYYFKKE